MATFFDLLSRVDAIILWRGAHTGTLGKDALSLGDDSAHQSHKDRSQAIYRAFQGNHGIR